jgi:tetratricopeptide (TPR) repeat protein
MGSKRKRAIKERAVPAAMAPTARSRLLATAVLVAVVAGVVGGATAFLLRRHKPVTIDLGTFTIDPARHTPATRPGADDATVYAAYSGSNSCKGCHWEAHEFWRKSHHGLAEREVDSKLDRAAFDPPVTFRHGSQQSTARVSGAKLEVVTQGFGGKVEAYEVKRVIGDSPLIQFLIEAPGGRIQTLEASFDPQKRQWFNVNGDEDRKPGEWGHWTGRGMNWQNQCASCHNTRVRKNYDAASDRYDLKMAQMTVSCESCHGPMKAHVEWRGKYPDATGEDPTTKAIDKEKMFDACGSCHARTNNLTGDFAPGESFFDHYRLVIPDETDIFHADGQVRDEDYEFAPFLGSRMHGAGVRCGDCHHPHSAKTVLPGNLLCMRCHGGPGTGSPYPNAPVIDEKGHTFHKAESAGSKCINCHMPQTTYMQRHGRHDHGFTVPDPLMTKEVGVPNACNRCHTDKDADWSLAAVNKWYGSRMEMPNRVVTRTRTRAVAAARRGDESAREALLGIAGGKDSAYWKAVACGLVGRWAEGSAAGRVLLDALKDSSPLVRAEAVRALERRRDSAAALRAMLSDPSRGVRLAAAWALRREIDLSTATGKELAWSLEHDLDQPLGRMRMGVFYASRGQGETALREYEKAIEWGAEFATFRYEAAVLLSEMGRPREAVAHLEKAVSRAPENDEFRFGLGLAYYEAGDLDKAIASLEEGLRRNPQHGRAWYNLGLARSAKGRLSEAAEALGRGEQADGSDPAIPYARATVLMKLGRRAEAADAARRTLALQPNHAQAASLLRTLTGSRPQ